MIGALSPGATIAIVLVSIVGAFVGAYLGARR